MERYRVVNRLEAAAAAYIAGLVDGEGTITLTSTHRGERRRIVVSIANTDRALLDYVREAVGAGYVTSKRTYHVRHTPSFCYSIRSRQALDLLSQIARFLRTYRRKRADIALAQYIASTPRNGKYSRTLDGQRMQFEREFLAIGPGPRSKMAK
jgi:hypothetical protein